MWTMSSKLKVKEINAMVVILFYAKSREVDERLGRRTEDKDVRTYPGPE